MLQTKAGRKKNDGKPYDTPPAWGITTREASKILGCSISAARLALHKKRVHYHLVQTGPTRRMYWKKSQVEKLATTRLPKIQAVPAKLIGTMETMSLLRLSRSSLQRYYRGGRLKAILMQFVIPGIGPRRRTYFLRAEVLNLAAKLNARRRRAEELDQAMDEARGME